MTLPLNAAQPHYNKYGLNQTKSSKDDYSAISITGDAAPWRLSNSRPGAKVAPRSHSSYSLQRLTMRRDRPQYEIILLYFLATITQARLLRDYNQPIDSYSRSGGI